MMTAAPKLYELDVDCPDCGAPPRVRVTHRELAKWRDELPGTLVQTYQCAFEFRPGRKCNKIYPITAAAMHGAQPFR